MTSPLRRPPRWSKKTDQLVRHVALRCRPGLQSELAHWIEDSPRFRTFITTNQDKVRKKLNTSDDDEHRMDMRAELLVAYLIVADRRFELSFEAYGARRLGPDLTVTFRTNQRFNLEVTRLRTTGDTGNATSGLTSGLLSSREAGSGLTSEEPSSREASGDPAIRDPGPGVARLANVITGKLRQLPGDIPNALVLAARGLPVSDDSLIAAMHLLKTHTDRKDDVFFARRGLKDARDFYAQFLHLGGIFVLDEATTPARTIFSPNREARHPLPQAAVTALMQCLTSAGGTPRA